MIRMLLVLLIIVGTMYVLLFRQAGEGETPQLRHQHNRDQAEGLEQQILQDAEDMQRQIDEMTQ